jgi:hypothetical protein
MKTLGIYEAIFIGKESVSLTKEQEILYKN